MQELKPCPFCGASAGKYWGALEGVICGSCQAQVIGAGPVDDIETWNRRAPDPVAARASVVDDNIDTAWNVLMQRRCATPVAERHKVKRILSVSRDDIAAAITAARSA
ncbi:MAG: hypothetical protein ACAH27_06055 [Xanthobacteraceae bacterium]